MPIAPGPFRVSIPGLWITYTQPQVDGVPLSGVFDFGDGRVLLSVGTPDGRFGWCDPECAVTEDVRSLDDLERVIQRDQALDATPAIELDGEEARSFVAGTGQRYVIAVHDRRPVAVQFDHGDWTVAPDIDDMILETFVFIDAAPAPVDQEIVTADGHVVMALSKRWRPAGDDPVIWHGTKQRMKVRMGSPDGTITTCDRPAGVWELCREVTATTLEDLAEAVRPGPERDPGIGGPIVVRTDGTLDGEPSVMTQIQAYEPPAHGGQEVVYIVAMHDGRPVIVRIHTTADHVVDLDSVIAGFRFVD